VRIVSQQFDDKRLLLFLEVLPDRVREREAERPPAVPHDLFDLFARVEVACLGQDNLDSLLLLLGRDLRIGRTPKFLN